MAYQKQTWINLPDQTTPISADRLNHIEGGIYNNSVEIENISVEVENCALITEAGNSIEFVLNTTNYKLSAILKDKNSNVISTSNEIDLPIESLVVDATYDSTTKELVFTLQSGGTLRVPVGDLISGLQEEITSTNKLPSDLVDDTNSTNKFVTSAEKTTWNNNEEEVERAKMVYNALPKVSDEDTEFTLDNTAECPMYEIGLRPSEISQATTTGKNLFDKSNAHYVEHLSFNSNTMAYASGGSSGANTYYMPCLPNTTYTYSKSLGSFLRVGSSPNIPAVGGTISVMNSETTGSSATITTGENDNYIAFYPLISSEVSTIGYDAVLATVQIELSPTATEYEEYSGGQPSPSPDYPQNIHVVSGNNTIVISNDDDTKEQNLPLNLDNLEYCKIDNYEDVFFKNVVGSEYYDSTLELNKWYLKKNIGKIILDGSENWETRATTTDYSYFISNILRNIAITGSTAYCDKFIRGTLNSVTDATTNKFSVSGGNLGTRFSILTSLLTENSIVGWEAWLSTNNTTVYYPLATSTNILLNNTLQTQLDNIQRVISYQGQTNVSQENNDLPFVIKLSAIRDMSVYIEQLQAQVEEQLKYYEEEN